MTTRDGTDVDIGNPLTRRRIDRDMSEPVEDARSVEWEELLSSVEDYDVGIDAGMVEDPEFGHGDAREYLEWKVLDEELVDEPWLGDIAHFFDGELQELAMKAHPNAGMVDIDPYDEFGVLYAEKAEEPGLEELRLLISHEREYVAVQVEEASEPGY